MHALRLPGQFTARGGTEGLSDEATNDLAASMAGLNASEADLRGPTGAAWANDQRKSKGGRCAEEQYIGVLTLTLTLSLTPTPTLSRCAEEQYMGVDLRLAVKPKKMHEIIHLVRAYA